MSRRTRTVLIASAIVATTLISLGLRSRGLRVVVSNTTPAPLVGVEIDHPGGTARLPRVGAGDSAEVRIRRPFALPGRPSGELPIRVTFRQRDDRSTPFPVRCSLGWVGMRRLDLEVAEAGVHRHVNLRAKMLGQTRVSYRLLARNTFRRGIGPRRFVAFRCDGVSHRVISRRDWAVEFGTAAAVISGARTEPIRGTIDGLEYSLYLAGELSRASRPRRPPRPAHLPFPDMDEAIRDTRTSVVHAPLWP